MSLERTFKPLPRRLKPFEKLMFNDSIWIDNPVIWLNSFMMGLRKESRFAEKIPKRIIPRIRLTTTANLVYFLIFLALSTFTRLGIRNSSYKRNLPILKKVWNVDNNIKNKAFDPHDFFSMC